MLNKLAAPPLPQELKLKDFPHLTIIKFADLSVDVSGQTDIIIGAEYFLSTLLQGQVVNPNSKIIAQNSNFEFLICGKLPAEYSSSETAFINMCNVNIDNELKRVCEKEEFFESGIDLPSSEVQVYKTPNPNFVEFQTANATKSMTTEEIQGENKFAKSFQ
ncbi:hypothetical protein AVEN_100460-1 [Araneus ventricosus]|uniref:Peptidase aspartic putative domain-containing protein n=1 Tax=Araneus ventricosus TaxID=182803 RepID=A0A4Y2MHV3_ARAVE|nr:hypothetical protein AVEN_100460-1 [Araneus ventricosus]